MTILRLSSPVQRACSRSAQKGNYRLRREYAAQYIGRSAMSSSSSNVVSAYFAICFPSFTYYVTTLSCTIGRRSVPNHSPDAVPVHVDIDLGPLKSVSRLHARIEYDEDSDCFVICILGRNGAWIDGVWARSGSRVPLGTKTSIQIASRTFQFLLATPSHPPPADSGLELSPTPSVVDITEAEPSLREQITPAPPSLSLSSLCCHAIDAAGGKATLGQIRRWLVAEYEWYRINEGWQPTVRQLLTTDPLFYKAKREKTYKGKDSLYSYRSSASKPTSTKAPTHRSMQTPQDNSDTRINPEGNDLDVEVADDDPPPFAGKRPLVRQSSSTSTNVRPVKKPKLSQKVPRRSLLDAAHLPASSATPDSISPSVPVSIPNLASKSSGSLASASTAMTSTTPHPSSTPNPTAPLLSLEERRRNRRRTELEETIQAALQERAAAVPPSEMNRVIGVPVRIDTPLPAGAPLDEKKKPLELLRGEIVLSPKHFSHVSPEQLQLLRRLDLPVVLGILQKEVKKAYIEELRAKKAKEAREAKAKAPLSATSIVRDASAPS